MLFDYDNSNPRSILEYGKHMENHTFRDLYLTYIKESLLKNSINTPTNLVIKEEGATYGDSYDAKGQLGNFIEKYYFGYQPNGNQDADFSNAGVELKQTPIDIKKNGEYTAGERLSITMISFREPVIDNFYESHLWEKIRAILLVHYIRDKAIDRLDYEIKFVNLFTPPEEDLQIIINDYNQINEKIKAGNADKISEGDTLYLGACTKGSTAAKSLVQQYYGDHSLAKRRNFCFKRSYMDFVLKKYILNNSIDTEKIIKDLSELRDNSFENIILNKLKPYYNKSDNELLHQFGVNRGKAEWITIIYRILGVKSNQAEEFIKANIKIKAVRVEENGNIREHMPLPTFKFKTIVSQSWDESDLCYLLSETKYLFVFFYKKGDVYYLRNAQFWNMGEDDLSIVEQEWNTVKTIIKDGVQFDIQSNGTIKNSLLGSSQSKIIHVRPHTAKSAYKLANGYKRGDLKYADQLPDGQWMTQQSFWINKEYLLEQFSLKSH